MKRSSDGDRRATLAGAAVLAWVLAGSLPGTAEAQGWIEPVQPQTGFTVEKVRTDVHVRVEGRVATFEVTEVFVNRGGRLAEGDYLIPLAGEAVFQGFSLVQGEEELRGEMMDAAEARRIYEEIVRRRADPALIELVGQGLLRARVFPIAPGEERKVVLRYTQLLHRSGDALKLVYRGALRGGVRVPHRGADRPVGPPSGAPAAAPGGSFTVEVVDATGLRDPFSPTHEVETIRVGRRMEVRVRDGAVGRLAVFFPRASAAMSLSVAAHRPEGDDGYLMLTLTPDAVEAQALPRDVVAVLDVSGSMSGEKIVQARGALHRVLESLRPRDRFRLVAFSNTVRVHGPGWLPATEEELERARAWVDRLAADGGTDIASALETALGVRSPADRLPVVLFLTDGLPTVGERSPERIADRVEAIVGRARIFAFGVGHDVNTHLLDRLGEAGRGSTDYVEPGEDVERVVAELASRIRSPVLTDLTLEVRGVELAEIYPVRLPDVFAGRDLVLFGRYRGSGDAEVEVRGVRAGREVRFRTTASFPRVSAGDAYVPRLWASRKLGHLERQIWTEGETPGLVAEIRRVALRYGLPSRYTAYLVEEPDVVTLEPVTTPRGGPLRPPELRDTRMERPAALAGAAGPGQATGAVAVARADEAARRREASSTAELDALDEALASALPADGVGRRSAAGRIFVLRDGVWTDIGHDPRREVLRVKLFSQAYFDLLQALPEIADALGEFRRVVVAGADVSLEVGPDGVTSLDARERDEFVRAFRGGAAAR